MGKIRFEFEGVSYEVDGSAYDKDLIKLPDGRVLQVVNGWSEIEPPKPNELALHEDQNADAPVAVHVE